MLVQSSSRNIFIKPFQVLQFQIYFERCNEPEHSKQILSRISSFNMCMHMVFCLVGTNMSVL